MISSIPSCLPGYTQELCTVLFFFLSWFDGDAKLSEKYMFELQINSHRVQVIFNLGVKLARQLLPVSQQLRCRCHTLPANEFSPVHFQHVALLTFCCSTAGLFHLLFVFFHYKFEVVNCRPKTKGVFALLQKYWPLTIYFSVIKDTRHPYFLNFLI